MRVLATYSKPEEAHVAGSLLRANGIEYFIRDENMVNTNWLYSRAIGGVKLEVLEEDYESAKELLDLPIDADVILKCPHCGSGNTKLRELSLLAVAFIGLFGFLFPTPSVTADCLDCGRAFKKGNPEPSAASSPDPRE